MKKIFLFGFLIFLALSGYAEENFVKDLNERHYNWTIVVDKNVRKHYLSLNVGGGLHSLLYSPKGGEKTSGMGGLLQVQYQYMLNERWGMGAALGVSSLHSSSLFNSETRQDPISVTDKQGIERLCTPAVLFQNMRETQNVWDLDLALQCFYQTPLSAQWTFQAGLGISVNFPLSMRYKITEGACGRIGYFKNNITMWGIDDYGFPKYTSENGKIEHESVNVGLLLDLGMYYALKEQRDLYMGLYLNYQFSSSVKSSGKEMLDSSASEYINCLNSNCVDKVHPLLLGVKLGLRFRLGR